MKNWHKRIIGVLLIFCTIMCIYNIILFTDTTNIESKVYYESAVNTNSDLKELTSIVGDVQRSDLIDKSEHLKVWYIYQNGDVYIVTIHNGQLDKKIMLN